MQSILTWMTTFGLVGSQNFNIAGAIGDGIALSMATTIVSTVIVGVPALPPLGPFPMGGLEVGKLL